MYILRLGQVHGEMQPFSRQVLGFAHGSPVAVPPGPSYGIFVFTVAESLRRIALGRAKPGCYMGVEEPYWTWEELHLYFARRAGIDLNFRLVPEDRRGALAVLARLPQSLAARGSRILGERKEILSGYVLNRLPRLEFKAKASYMLRKARMQIALGGVGSKDHPYAWAFSGLAPGRRLPGLPDSRVAMDEPAGLVRALLEKVSSC